MLWLSQPHNNLLFGFSKEIVAYKHTSHSSNIRFCWITVLLGHLACVGYKTDVGKSFRN